jgi:hypothetical protein
MKAAEDQLNKVLNPVLPTLRQMAELQKIYRDVYGVTDDDFNEVEPVHVIEVPKTAMKPKIKTKKDTLFVKPIVAFPTGAVWQTATLVTKDDDSIEFLYKKVSLGVFTHEELGLIRGNTSDKKPNRECALLRVMAVVFGYRSIKDVVLTKQELMKVCDVGSENAVEKQKSDLATKLRIITGIHEEPFLPYSSHMGYQPKFELLPETMLQGDPELYPSGREFIDEEFDGATLRT